MRRVTKLLVRLVIIAACLMLLTGATILAVGRYFGYQVLSVQSNSMAPTFSKGDAVVLQRKGTTLKVGDVISYTSPLAPQLTVTHRITHTFADTGYVETKGDNLLTSDPLVPLSAVRGVVRHHLNRVGVVLDAVRQPLGLAVLIYVPALVIITAEVRRLVVRSSKSRGRYSLYGY